MNEEKLITLQQASQISNIGINILRKEVNKNKKLIFVNCRNQKLIYKDRFENYINKLVFIKTGE